MARQHSPPPEIKEGGRVMARMFALRRRLALLICPKDGAVFVPGYLASGVIRAVATVLSPVVMAGPEIEKRLRPHAERLCDIPTPSRAERLRRAALLWLIGWPEIEPDTTEMQPHPREAWQDALFAEMGLLQGRRMPPSGGSASAAAPAPNDCQGIPPALPVLPAAADRGVR